MKKFIAVFIAIGLCFSLCACQKNIPDTEESTVITTEEEGTVITAEEQISEKEGTVIATEKQISKTVASEKSEKIAEKAREAYASYIALFSGEGQEEDEGITSALVVDLDKNNVPEVIFSYYGYHNMYILSYSENNGLSIISPILHSSSPAEIYFSEDNAVLYYTDSGHNLGSSWYHEGVCLKATSEGFETVGTVSGDTWDGVSDETWENEELLLKADSEYDDAFNIGMKELTGNGNYVDFFDVCESENAEKYLEEKLSADFSAKKDEYSKFKKTALSVLGTEPLSINVADYDRNGTYEAFAITGEEISDEVQGEYYNGTVWFISDEGKAKSLGDYDCWSEGEILDCQYNSYYQIWLVAGSSSPSALWKVSGNTCKEITEFRENGVDYFNLTSVGAHSNSVIASVNKFDAVVENVDDTENGTGHTYKPCFYYDTPDGIKEYGGIRINEAQLETLGGKAYLDLIEKEGYTVKDIYVRENGIINVNFYKYDGEYFYNCYYINLKITNNGVCSLDGELTKREVPYELEEIMGEGFYTAASVPDLATYPDDNF